MTTPRDPDRLIRAFLEEGSERLVDQVYDAVRAEIDTKRQRVVIGPWRMPAVNKLVPIGLGAVAVVAVLVVGGQRFRPGEPGGGGAAGTASGGSVTYQLDGAAATTEVSVAEGAGVSGTAVTTVRGGGTHTVSVECAARDGGTWAVGGTVEETTFPGEGAGSWSAVIVRDGSPQRIGIWLSDPKTEGVDCAGWLAGIDLSTIGAENFVPVESGTLVPPPT
jgi:hypothetical protein